MKFIQMTLLCTVLALAACAGNSKKNPDAASKRDSVATQERCPPGTLYDQFTRQCVEQTAQARRRTPLRDTLGRPMDTSFPEMSMPATGGLLGR